MNGSSIYELTSSHGMAVSSIMAGQWDANLVGTAPHAHYLLCSTENSDQETRLEEIAWIEAAEYADSLGVDVLNTSLGYSDFDGTSYDYTYRDMDGQSTYISRAASLCASRGMILCTSAGNSGNDDWYYITAPADATDVLSVGAVDSTNVLANFSSRGPSYDARIKPDITAMGYRTGIQYRDGRVVRGNGTSFASPVMAGSVASLWQAFPDLSFEIVSQAETGGGRLAAEWLMRGTNTGSFRGLPPTGRRAAGGSITSTSAGRSPPRRLFARRRNSSISTVGARKQSISRSVSASSSSAASGALSLASTGEAMKSALVIPFSRALMRASSTASGRISTPISRSTRWTRTATSPSRPPAARATPRGS